MEIIRRKTDYGIRALAHMALSTSDNKVFGARDIAAERGVPSVFMQKVLHALAEVGILQAHRGVFGGFSLLKAPEEITLLNIMEALQGPFAINKCVLSEELCTREEECAVRGRWDGVQSRLADVLRTTTLADLISDGPVRSARHSSLLRLDDDLDGVVRRRDQAKPLGGLV